MITNSDLSIVIPCKNEEFNVINTLNSLHNQKNIHHINIFIADNSDDNITKNILDCNIKRFGDKFNIKIIQGGFPAQARLNGSKLCKSDYILFIDADILLKDDHTIYNSFIKLKHSKKHLLTIPFKTNDHFSIVYMFFNLFQFISIILNSPFALGGFQLWKSSQYWKSGGYNPDLLFAEDYAMSSKINKNNFIVYHKHKAITDSRRFKNKGVFYMFKMMILSYFNRNNQNFFKSSHNYWS